MHAAPCVDQEAVAIAAAEQCHRGGRGAEDHAFGDLGAEGADAVGRLARLTVVLARNDDRGPAAEGRGARLAAHLGFGRIEGIAVARGQRGNHRRVGVAGLQQHFARFRSASRAPGDLRDLLVGPLARAQIAALEAEIGIDHADQRQLGEMEPLGYQLRADDHVHLACLDRSDELRRAAGRIERVGSGDKDTCLRQAFGHFVGDPFDPGAAGDEAVGFAAFGAGLGGGRLVPAMVAGEPVGEAVFDQPRAAIGALVAKAAIAAQRQRGIAAPVEEQQRLFAAFQPRLDPVDQPLRQPHALRRLFLGQVDRLYRGHLRPAVAARQVDLRIDPAFGHLQAFERGGGAGEHHGHLLEMPAHHRDVARIVAHALFLLEAGLMRFVDHDQAEPREGQEQR